MKNITYWAASYINTKADRIENNDCLDNPLKEKGFVIDLRTPAEQNHLLVLKLEQIGGYAQLTLRINNDDMTFKANCDNALPAQEKFNMVVNNNIDQIIAAVQARMIEN